MCQANRGARNCARGWAALGTSDVPLRVSSTAAGVERVKGGTAGGGLETGARPGGVLELSLLGWGQASIHPPASQYER